MTSGALVEEPDDAARAYLGASFEALTTFGRMLASEGEVRGLIGPRELPRLWSRHILNSAAVVPFLPDVPAVADIGSGAGFPGIVVAAQRPNTEVHLVEPMERRIEWLSEVVDELGLDNVVLHRARAEELHGELIVGAVTARAVAALDKLARWSAPLLRRPGTLVALKGERAGEEVAAAEKALRKLRFQAIKVHDVVVPMSSRATRVVVAEQ